MSVYYNKKLISGVRDVPQMTLAEYNALTNKPDLWLRTDAPESDRGISASDVEYSTGVSVKDKIDETNNKINARFDIVNGGGASDANLTGLTEGKVYIHVSAGGKQNFPTNGDGYLQTFLNPNTTLYGRQMYYSNEGLFTRKLQGGNWGSWTTIAN